MFYVFLLNFFFFQAEDGIRDLYVTGVQTCALPISVGHAHTGPLEGRGRVELPGVVADAVEHLGGEVARLQQREQAHPLLGVVEAAGRELLEGPTRRRGRSRRGRGRGRPRWPWRAGR